MLRNQALRYGIPVTSRQGLQLVALAFAAGLLVTAYFLVTINRPWPFYGCTPELPAASALFLAAVRAVLAAGFVIAAFRNLEGPRLKDPLLIGLVLALVASLALSGGAHTLATGIARFGNSGCLTVGTPWSYAIAIATLAIGALALFAAVLVWRGEGGDD